MAERLQIQAHAKLNLFLRILSKESSGFHGIETLFTLIELADTIRGERSARGIELNVKGADVGPVEQNLAYRAADLMLAATGRRFGVRLHLTKRIPVRAGLGGGSSDAAATLHLVNAMADRPLPRHELLQIAAKLGSDVPFLASGAAMALAWNRGERLFRLTPPKPAPALLMIPEVSVSTPEAYRMADGARGEPDRRGSVLLDVEAFQTWGDIGRLGGNDFESPIFAREPGLKAKYERLAETRPLAARMSGSGSALFGVYRSESLLDDAAMMLAAPGVTLIRTATRAAPGPGPSTP